MLELRSGLARTESEMNRENYEELRRSLNDHPLKLENGDPQVRADLEQGYRDALADFKEAIRDSRGK